MVSSEHSVDELIELVEELQERVATLEAENERLREENERLRNENERLRKTVEEQAETIATLKARLKRYENAHTPPSKQRSATSGSDGDGDDEPGESSSDTDTADGDDEARTDGGTVGRNKGHEPTWRAMGDIDDVNDVTLGACPDCGDDLGRASEVITRIIEELPEPPPIETIQYNLHEYVCDGCESTVRATHPDCPAEGSFGVNVLAQAAYARYECRLPYRKIADRFEDLLGLEMSGASAWHCVERVAEAGRDEYETIREHLRDAAVVHVDETGQSLDGDQGWLWTFKTEDAILYEINTSRGSKVLEEVLGEDFDGTLVNDGWTAYPAFTDAFQRCWAHLLREADDLAEHHSEAERIASMLHRLYEWVQDFLATDPSDEARERMRERALAYLEDIVAMDVTSDDVQQFLGKLEGGLGHWLVFVTDPDVAPTNNAAENAIREPVVLRKIIGTLRTESGQFVHETVLSLLATWEQQDLNPYDQLKRVVTPEPT